MRWNRAKPGLITGGCPVCRQPDPFCPVPRQNFPGPQPSRTRPEVALHTSIPRLAPSDTSTRILRYPGAHTPRGHLARTDTSPRKDRDPGYTYPEVGSHTPIGCRAYVQTPANTPETLSPTPILRRAHTDTSIDTDPDPRCRRPRSPCHDPRPVTPRPRPA